MNREARQHRAHVRVVGCIRDRRNRVCVGARHRRSEVGCDQAIAGNRNGVGRPKQASVRRSARQRERDRDVRCVGRSGKDQRLVARVGELDRGGVNLEYVGDGIGDVAQRAVQRDCAGSACIGNVNTAVDIDRDPDRSRQPGEDGVAVGASGRVAEDLQVGCIGDVEIARCIHRNARGSEGGCAEVDGRLARADTQFDDATVALVSDVQIARCVEREAGGRAEACDR